MKTSKFSLQDFQSNKEKDLAPESSVHDSEELVETQIKKKEVEQIDLAKLKEDSYRLGFEDAKKEMEGQSYEHQKKVEQLLSSIEQELHGSKSKIENLINDSVSSAARLSMDIARKVVGVILDSKSSELIAKFICENIISSDLEIEVIVPQGLAESVSNLLSSKKIDIKIAESGDLSQGSCIINFGEGKVIYDKNKVLDEIESIIHSNS